MAARIIRILKRFSSIPNLLTVAAVLLTGTIIAAPATKTNAANDQ